MGLHFNLSIRKYVAHNIRPLMYELLGQNEFIPSAMSTSYISRTIFEDVRKNFPDYIIKFSSDNPRNPVNKAGPEELKIIKHFNKQPHLKIWKGVIKIKGNQYMGIFSARRMETSCLRCHGDPKDAPNSLIEKYGDKAGFHRPIGEIIGMDVVAIPLGKITEGLWDKSKNISFLTIGALLLFFLSTVVVMRFVIIKRIQRVAGHFGKITSQKNYVHIEPIKIEGKDEISQMAKGFNLLVGELSQFYVALENKVTLRTKALQDKNKQLENEIAHHLETEKALKESEIRFKSLHNASFGGIAIHDKGVILECNKGLSKITGYSYDELIGIDGLSLISDATREQVIQNIEADYEKDYEVMGVRKNGEIYPLRLEARKIPYKGKDVRVVEFRDITEIKLAEKEKVSLKHQLQQSQKMEAVGRLAGGVAHDFNNMLGVILGHTEMIKEQMEPGHDFYEGLEEIYSAAKRSVDLTSQLLAYARKQTVSPKIIDFNKAVGSLTKMLRRLLGEDIDLTWLPGDNLFPVKIDPGQVNQILVNLCINARDAIKSAGSITIETTNAIVDKTYRKNHVGLIPGEYVKLVVVDNGCGMDTETISNIFEPFFTTKQLGEGTGLGLATVYGIVKQNKGYIYADSKPGQGTSINIYLPKQKGAEVVHHPETESSDSAEIQGDETILLVEDELANLEITTLMLEREGYHVLGAATPDEAINIANQYPKKIHLLLTDVVMPKMNGRDLTNKIESLHPNVKSLFMSGYTADIISDQGVLEDDVNFIQKPFLREDLVTKVREVLTF